MYGIEFVSVSMSAGCGSCEFESRKRSGSRFFKMIFGGIWEIYEKGKIILKNPSLKEFEELLPKSGDFGKNWKAGEFMLAMTFFGEGQRMGNHERFNEHRKPYNPL